MGRAGAINPSFPLTVPVVEFFCFSSRLGLFPSKCLQLLGDGEGKYITCLCNRLHGGWPALGVGGPDRHRVGEPTSQLVLSWLHAQLAGCNLA